MELIHYNIIAWLTVLLVHEAGHFIVYRLLAGRWNKVKVWLWGAIGIEEQELYRLNTLQIILVAYAGIVSGALVLLIYVTKMIPIVNNMMWANYQFLVYTFMSMGDIATIIECAMMTTKSNKKDMYIDVKLRKIVENGRKSIEHRRALDSVCPGPMIRKDNVNVSLLTTGLILFLLASMLTLVSCTSPESELVDKSIKNNEECPPLVLRPENEMLRQEIVDGCCVYHYNSSGMLRNYTVCGK